MARISTAQVGAIYRVTLMGRLTANDLKRLEAACGSALQEKLAPLELDIRRVTGVDAVAQAYLQRLKARGARIDGEYVLDQDVQIVGRSEPPY